MYENLSLISVLHAANGQQNSPKKVTVLKELPHQSSNLLERQTLLSTKTTAANICITSYLRTMLYH